MRLQASLAFALIVLAAAAAQAAAPPDITPWLRWIPYRYDTRPRNVALLNDMPCSLLSHPNGWGGLYLTNASSGGHDFFVDLPDCSAPAGSGWTIPIFFRSRERLPDLRVAVGGLVALPFMTAATRPFMAALAHGPAVDSVGARGDAYRPPGALARWRDRPASPPDSGAGNAMVPAMPRTDGARTRRPSDLPQAGRQNPFSGPAPGAPSAQPMTPGRTCCVSAEPRARPMGSRRIHR